MNYATIPDLRSNLSLVDDEDGAALERVLSSASRAVDNHCCRRFWLDPEPTVRIYTAACGDLLVTDDIGDADVVVATDDNGDGVYETTWATGDVRLGPLNASAHDRPWKTVQPALSSARRFPSGVGRVQVTARFGWPSVPPAVIDATLLQAARWFHRKDTPFAIADAVAGETSLRLFSTLDPDVVVLLKDFRREAVFVA